MDITSIWYMLFIMALLWMYWLAPKKIKWIVLLGGSIFFYIINNQSYTCFYILINVFVVYIATNAFQNNSNLLCKKILLIFTLVINIGMLGVLKYTNMFIGTYNFFSRENISFVDWLAPMAISYYILQLTAYTLDCYWGTICVEKNFGKLLLFTIYFPLLISGPICRWPEIGEQLFEDHSFEYDQVTSGMRRAIWGVAKKLIVADHLYTIVNVMFEDPNTFSGFWIIIAAMLFAVQLYFDFSGCMDIVIGVSKCFGIILPENFRTPFLSKSVQEFWQRWHITLGAWMKNYVMYPLLKTDAFVWLGQECKKRFGKKGKKIPAYIAMLVVWIAIGIWHGSSWKYVIGQGCFFWLVIVLEQILDPTFKKVKQTLHIKEQDLLLQTIQVVRTGVLFAIGNIAFRASSLSNTFFMYKQIFKWSGIATQIQILKDLIMNNWGVEIILAVSVIVILQIVDDIYAAQGKNVQSLIVTKPIGLRWICYLAIVFMILFFRNTGETAFVYFQF